jgi:hypothetical protein
MCPRISIRHAYASGVDQPDVSNHPIKSHVSVAANNQVDFQSGDEFADALITRPVGDHFDVTSRRSMTEQHPS